MEFWKSQKGVHSIEVIISVAIFTFLVTGVFILFGSSILEGEGMIKRSRADALITEGMNAVRSMRDRDPSLLVAGDHGLVLNGTDWEFFGTQDQTDSTFLRKVTVTDLEMDGFDVTVDVGWLFWGRLISRVVSTRFTDWENVEVWGDWENPTIVASLDIGPQGKATAVDRDGDTVYLTSDASSRSAPTFFTIDISTPTSPVILDSEVIGKDQRDVIHLPGTDIVYVVGDDGDKEAITYNANDPSNLIRLTDNDLDSNGFSVAVLDNLMAIGTAADIQIFDISTPTAPVWLSTFPVNGHVHGIEIAGDRVYAATDDNDRELIILSIATPSAPVLTNFIDLPDSDNGRAVEVIDDILYFGRNRSGGDELFKYDRTDPDNLVLLDSEEVGHDVNDIAVAGPYVYLATAFSNEEFKIYLSNSNGIEYMTGLNMSQVATGIVFNDNTIFISLRSNDAFQIIQPAP